MGRVFLVLAVVVLVIYALYWLRAGRPRPGRPGRPAHPSVRGPDDDPDFLRGLDPPPRRDPDEEPTEA